MKKLLAYSICFLLVFQANIAYSKTNHKAASDLSVVSYARTLLYTIVDSSFRGSWVIDPENWEEAEQKTKKVQKSFNSLAKVKIGSTSKQVKEILGNPQETRNNGTIWVYGKRQVDGTYEGLLEVFFDEKKEKVIGITAFDPQYVVEDIDVVIGDSIDKMVAVYGEPVDEKDFIEDPDNKNYLGLYYLYPRSGIGFLIGQDKATNDLLVYGVLVYGNS